MKPLPDVTKWIPIEKESLSEAYLNQCKIAECNIKAKYKTERDKNIYQFDSGTSLEEIIISEFNNLFSKRYQITNGKVSDSKGSTAGHCDILFFNDTWFPVALSGGVENSKKHFYPIDGIYAIGEIKATLNIKTLDDACEKLVKTSRLHRLRTKRNRLIENRESTNCTHGLSNPLYTFIVAESLDSKTDFEDIIKRFIEINKLLPRMNMIRALCVLGHGTVTWSFLDEEKQELKSALFMSDDLYKSLYITFVDGLNKSLSLYALVLNLQLHLFHSVLPAEDFAWFYGTEHLGAKHAMSSKDEVKVDNEWTLMKNHRCVDE